VITELSVSLLIGAVPRTESSTFMG